MKKQLLLFFMMLLPIMASADAVEIDEIYYNLIRGEIAEVTSNPDQYSGNVVIPESVVYEGKKYSVTSVGQKAFYDCSDLTSVTIPNSVTSIGNYAFYECSGLTSVTIPNNVTSIGDGVFRGCNGLSLVTIPNSVTSIGKEAFYYCSGLTSVNIPNSVTCINGSAFYGCSGLTSVTIPNSVTFIGGSAFCNCSGLTSVTIPNSVTSIQYMTFRDCSSLTSVTIPNSVTEIGIGAFLSCSGLTSVSIPSSVTSIGDHAFDGCWDLTSVTIPSRVTSIGWNAFYACSGLTEVTSEIHNPFVIGDNVFEGISHNAILQVPTGEKSKYEAISGWAKNFKEIVETEGNNTTTERTIHVATAGTLADYISEAEKYNIDELTLTGELNGTDFRLLRDMAGNDYLGQETEGRLTVLDLSNAKIVAGGETYLETKSLNGYSRSMSGNFHYSVSYNNVIPQYVFYLCNLKIVNIPNSVTKIEDGAFLSCSSLTSVTISNGVTSIGSQAFDSCRGLAFVTIPNNVTSIGFGVFAGCRNLTSVTISNSVTSIGERAFYGCSGLTSVTIPNSVTSINREVFYMCSGLTSVTIPNSVTSIEKWAFRFCNGLTSVTIPNSVTSIGEQAFSDCSALTSVTIPNSVRFIGKEAFRDCNNLTSVTVYVQTPISIDNCCFTNRANATLYVPAASKVAYQEADYWKEFKQIVEVDEVSSEAYAVWCEGNKTLYFLSSTEMPVVGGNYDGQSITRIWRERDVIDSPVTNSYPAWYQMVSGTITRVVVDESFQEVRVHSTKRWFYLFPALQSIEGLTNLNTSQVTDMSEMFYGCSKLTSLNVSNFDTSNVTDMSEMFRSCSSITSLDVSNFNTANVTKMSAMFWECSSLTSLDLSNFNTTSIVQYYGPTFKNSSSLTTVILPNTLKCIESEAFYGCSSLSSITIPNSVTSFGTNVLGNCTSLTSVTIPNSVTDMGSGAFKYCSSLTSVTIPNSVTTIGFQTFFGCSSLASITIPISVTSIGPGAFGNCIALIDVHCYAENVPDTDPNAFDASIIENATLHVPAQSIDAYKAAEPWKKFKSIVGIQSVEPIEGETMVNTENLNGQDLSDNVVDGVYYNVGEDGYDATDGSIVISETTNMGQITDSEPGSEDVKNNFTGIILKVAAGKGTIKVNVKTSGNAQLVVQVGNGTPMIASKTEQGDVVVSYDIEEDTYVYIYAVIGSSAALTRRASSTDEVRIYGFTVSPGASGVRAIWTNEDGNAQIFSLDGKPLNKPQKGIFIKNRKKYVVK